MKKMKRDDTLSSLIMIAVGVLMVLFAGEGLAVVLRVLGGGLLIVGGIGVASYFLGKNDAQKNFWKMLIAAAEAIAGLVILINPKFVLSIYPVVVGLIIILHGLWDLLNALNNKRKNAVSWKPLLVLSIITIVLGIMIVCRPFATADLLTTVIGAVLAYDGFTGLLAARK